MRRVLLLRESWPVLFVYFQVRSGPADSQTASACGIEQKPFRPPLRFVGSETCATCTMRSAKKFSSNPQPALALEHGNQGISCEGLPRAGKAHVMAARRDVYPHKYRVGQYALGPPPKEDRRRPCLYICDKESATPFDDVQSTTKARCVSCPEFVHATAYLPLTARRG